MDWLQISVYADTENFEIVSAFLDSHGLSETEWVEGVAHIQAFLDAHKSEWDYVDAAVLAQNPPCVRAYVRDDENGRSVIARLRESLPALKNIPDMSPGPLDLSVARMKEEDWADNWKQYFHPFALGKRLYIRPPWECLDAPAGRTALTVDPGMLFGTGSHPTTQMCLLALENRVASGIRVLDIGCGSGILSIAALLLGARQAVAVDIDPHAPKTVMHNARFNGIDESVLSVFAGNILTDAALRAQLASPRAELVVANIVADVILPLIPLAVPMLLEGGQLIVSGIIDEREAEVEAALRQNGFTAISRMTQGDWRLFCASLC